MAAYIDIYDSKWSQRCFGFVIVLLVFTSSFAYGRKTLEARRLTNDTQKYYSVNLGGWLVIEGWIKPSLFDGIPDNDLLDGTQIQLKSMKLGTYVVAEDGGGKIVAVNRTSPSGWETFKIWRVKDGYYQLRVFNKEFIGVDNGGGVIVKAVATTPNSSETFQIIRNSTNPNTVHIKAFNGMYLQAQSKDQLTADFEGEPGWDDNNAATFEMSFAGKLQGEFQISNGYGPERAAQVLNEHRSTFITEDDFVFMSNHGINAVRIPVGWWIASDPKPPAPFVGGSLACLDKAFSWAQNHDIKVIIDLHAAPGSQNGDDHSGSRDGSIEWPESQENIDMSLSTIDFLAARYAAQSALLGIELLNEPRSPGVSLDNVTAYYSRGYDIVRKYSSSAYVIMWAAACEEAYGFLPCTESALGNLFLLAVYGYLIYVAASLLLEGNELLLAVKGPGTIGGLILPVVGAFPYALLILVTLILVKGNASTADNESDSEILVKGSVLFFTIFREFILQLARPLLYLLSQGKGLIFWGLKLGRSRRGIVLLILMMSIAAAVTHTAGEDVPVGDKLPPSCHYVAKCGDCLPCFPVQRQGYRCCDEY